MIRRLVLSSKHIEELKKFAMDSLPLESCALMLGKINDDNAIVSKVVFTKNADKSKTTFSIDPNELLNAYKEAESSGLDIVGIFHSHPAPAKPSALDAKYMELNPIPWLIMSTVNNELMAFLYDNAILRLELAVS
jgi:proteasome lid subunit RPN8/RPN11